MRLLRMKYLKCKCFLRTKQPNACTNIRCRNFYNVHFTINSCHFIQYYIQWHIKWEFKIFQNSGTKTKNKKKITRTNEMNLREMYGSCMRDVTIHIRFKIKEILLCFFHLLGSPCWVYRCDSAIDAGMGHCSHVF